MASSKIQILSGNELIVRGGLEAGFSLYTGYPGSPLADYFTILKSKATSLKKRGVRVALANSEGNAAAMAHGAKAAGRDVLVAMKSMGLHVASDALSVGNFSNPVAPTVDPDTGEPCYSGVVIVSGDDPWSMSTATPADSRYLFKHLHMPFLQPATPQELKDWMSHALTISRYSSVYTGVLVTTAIAEGGGRVTVGEEAPVLDDLVELDTASFDLRANVMVPPNSLFADQSMINQRFPKVRQILEQLSLDQIEGCRDSKIGFIAAGLVHESLKQVLKDQNALDDSSTYKVACSYPLVESKLIPWLKGLDQLVVVEEKRGFLEAEIVELCQREQIRLTIQGKQFTHNDKIVTGFPSHGGLDYEQINDKLLELMALLGAACIDQRDAVKSCGITMPRLPIFCPGCPHRETLSLLKWLRRELAESGADLISHGDVGCYALSFLPPFHEMHGVSGMGQGGSMGAGADLFTKNPSVVLMGDSTFFHTGITSISNSVQIGHDITYILLKNDHTAMTGHQVVPNSGWSVEGVSRPAQDMSTLVKSLGVDHATVIDPSNRKRYKKLLQSYVNLPGTKVIISEKECGLTYYGRERSRDNANFKSGKVKSEQVFYTINSDTCEDCRICVEQVGCPGLTRMEDAYGSKMKIDPDICVSDGYCAQLLACPSFEKITVSNYHPSKYRPVKTASLSDAENSLPEPHMIKRLEDIATGKSWRIVVSGVGGSGVTTITRVIATAAARMGGRDDLDFRFFDQKGLAQRNGRVTGHAAIVPRGTSTGPITPLGAADLVLSTDLLDGSQALSFLNSDGMAVFDKAFQPPLSVLLDRGEEAEVLSDEKLRSELEQQFSHQVSIVAAKDICMSKLGRGIYASAMVLGIAFQKGRIPFGLSDLREAFELSVPKTELENNWQAFILGRHWALNEWSNEREQNEASAQSERPRLERSLVDSLALYENATDIRKQFSETIDRVTALFFDISKNHICRYVHDILLYDRGRKLSSYMQQLEKINQLFDDTEQRAIALRVLSKTYWIKDEVFVSHQLASSLRHEELSQQFDSLGTDWRVELFNRAEIPLGEGTELPIAIQKGGLRLVRHARFLRWIPSWHRQEKLIAKQIRDKLLNGFEQLAPKVWRKHLMQLDNIKGYRSVRYERALAVDLPKASAV